MSARIVMASAWFPPYDLGGTEVYVDGLIRALHSIGFDCTVLAPRAEGAPDQYSHDGIVVETYRVGEKLDDTGVEEFSRLLSHHAGAIFHLHSWTRGCGPAHLARARALGFDTVVTVHTPAALCMRGTMRLYGGAACDGRIDAVRCAACRAQARGAPAPIAQMLAHIPETLARRARAFPFGAGLGVRALAMEKQQELQNLFSDADRVVAVCRWLEAALRENGAPGGKLSVSRQGLPMRWLNAPTLAEKAPTEALRLVFLGRFDVVKGVDTIVMALRRLPHDCAIDLTIHAVASTEEERAFEAHVRALAGDDARIAIAPPLRPDEAPARLRDFDAMVIPSRWMETGPLTALEARASGLVIVGSRLGGIAEIADENEGDILVAPDDVAAWAKAIAGLALRKRQGAMPHDVRPVRGMNDVAMDMRALYRGFAA
ncbi:MAG: glycosyltransferase [Hyphomicrobiales bacterium]|nr:glycosyltransferase [Hyphomicrobiales bacterium]